MPGKHWAVVIKDAVMGDKVEFVAGPSRGGPTDKRTVEAGWREARGLKYVPVEVRKTTPAEDEHLPGGAKYVE